MSNPSETIISGASSTVRVKPSFNKSDANAARVAVANVFELNVSLAALAMVLFGQFVSDSKSCMSFGDAFLPRGASCHNWT